MRDVLSAEAVARRGWLDAGYVTKLMDEHESGFANHGSLLWGLLSVELWARLFLDGPPRPPSTVEASSAAAA